MNAVVHSLSPILLAGLMLNQHVTIAYPTGRERIPRFPHPLLLFFYGSRKVFLGKKNKNIFFMILTLLFAGPGWGGIIEG